MIEIARVYDKRTNRHSRHFLVERLWPRGMKKESLKMDGWLKDVAPSGALRKWFGHKPERWEEFRKRYRAELAKNEAAWKPLLDEARKEDVTLLYSARDVEHNGAIVLRDFLNSKLRR